MNPFKYIIYSALMMMFLFLLIQCGGDRTIELEEEKVLYRNRIDSTLDKIERKLAALQTRYSPADTITEKMDTAAVDELAEPQIDVEPMQRATMNLENLEDELNRKLAEIDHVTDEEWQQLKAEIDQLIAKYDRIVKESESG